MDIGSFHPIFVHFPVVLLTLAVLFDMGQYLFFDKHPSNYAHWLFFLGGLTIIPSIITGYSAATGHNENIYLLLHKSMAFFLAALVMIQIVIRICLLKGIYLISGKYIIFLSFIIFLLISLTGEVGGILARGSSPFTPAKSKDDFDYNSADSNEVRTYNPEQLAKYLEKKVDVLDVIPIFKRHQCSKCHAEFFEGDLPAKFSIAAGDQPAWLPRDDQNQLIDWPQSPFYRTTVLLNRMPIDEEKNSKGISWSERLTLVRWLENNAPTEVPKLVDEEL